MKPFDLLAFYEDRRRRRAKFARLVAAARAEVDRLLQRRPNAHIPVRLRRAARLDNPPIHPRVAWLVQPEAEFQAELNSIGYYKRMDELRSLKRQTRQALALARAKVLTDARATVEAGGPTAIVVTHLARTHGVAPLTARRWLAAAGFSLDHLARGRPSFARLAELADDGE